jgi:hypothetical protein
MKNPSVEPTPTGRRRSRVGIAGLLVGAVLSVGMATGVAEAGKPLTTDTDPILQSLSSGIRW